MSPPDIMVNLGCGLQAPPGWYNMDRSPALVLDRMRPLKRALFRVGVLTPAHMAEWPRSIHMRSVNRPLPFADGSVAAVYSSHMLEHLYLADARAVLVECHRVLRDGAPIRLALPNTAALADLLVDEGPGDEGGERGREFNRRLGAYPEVRPAGRNLPRTLLSGGHHRWQPTPGLVRSMLDDAGFADIRRCAFLEGDLPDLANIEHREKSLFMEATASHH